MPAPTFHLPVFRLLIDVPSATEGDAAGPLSPALKRVLGRASQRSDAAAGAHARIAAALGWPIPADAPWALAWRSAAENRAAGSDPPRVPRRWWLLEPVTLLAGMNSVALGPLAAALDADALETLAKELAGVFGGSPWTLTAWAGRLMLDAEADCAVRSHPVFECVGRDLRDRLPSGDQAGLLRRLMTECQMRLHALSETGAVRLQGVTGVWPWGEGQSGAVHRDHAGREAGRGGGAILSHDPLIAALIAWSADPQPADRPGQPDFEQATANLLATPPVTSQGADLIWHGPHDHPALPALIGRACSMLWRRRIARVECTLLPARGGGLASTAVLTWSDLLRFWKPARSA